MRVNRLRLVLLLVLSAALVGAASGCGKKGPLYIPPENSAMAG